MAAFDRPGAVVIDKPLQDEIKESFLEYGYSVIHARAIPDARDGLKPVQRRILFGMHVGGLRPDKGFVKSARIVGDVMGHYHPHGDSAIYEALVRMAQDFSWNTPVVDGHGNFGSPDDAPAAARYTEARMSPFAVLATEGIDESTVDFRPTYAGDGEEPTVLPMAFPSLLVNGGTGIAVGMATNMIPHNLGETVSAARWLINHPECTLDDLMAHIPGPDLPTGGLLLGADAVREAYETGRGVVRLRARVEVGPLEGSRGRQAITVVELPFEVGPEKVIRGIREAVTAGKLVGVADVKDLTDMNSEGTRVVIETKTGVNPHALLADLYRWTPLEVSFGINNLALVEGRPVTLGLKALLEVFVQHRFEVVARRTRYRRTKRATRLHLVEGLLRAMVDIDAVIRLIRASENATAAKTGLMDHFGLSDPQATYILDTPLRRLTRFDAVELETERGRLQSEIGDLTRVLEDDQVLRAVVSEELAEVAQTHARPRQTTLVDGDLKEAIATTAVSTPLEVADDPCDVLLSATGLLARTRVASEHAPESGRARRGRSKHDAIAAVCPATARGTVVLVTNTGRAFKSSVLDLPALPDRPGTVCLAGMLPATELVALHPGERVVAVCPDSPPSATESGSAGVLALGTRNGVVKFVRPQWPVRSDEFCVIALGEGDEVVGGAWVETHQEGWLVFVTSDANLLRFEVDKVRPQGLSGGGVVGVKLASTATAVSFNVVAPGALEDAMAVVSTGGGVKVTPLAAYPPKGRATGGVRCLRFLKTRGVDDSTQVRVAWVGPSPVGATLTGEPADLPPVDARRDGSGETMLGPDLVGANITADES